jgi:hypothetical protein
MSIKDMTNSAGKSSIRRGFLMAVLAAVLTGVGGFCGGQWWEKHEAEIRTAKAVEILTRSEEARNLYVMRLAIVDLRAGRTVDGETKLLRYAKLKVPAVSECRQSPECTFWAGRLLPSSVELSELAEMKERK